MTISLSFCLSSLFLVAGEIATASKKDARSGIISDAWRVNVTKDLPISPHVLPKSCQDSDFGSGDTSTWPLITDPGSLTTCNVTMLLSFNARATAIRGCMADYSFSNAQQNSARSNNGDVLTTCSTSNYDIVEASATIGEPAGDATRSNTKVFPDDLLCAGRQIQNYLSIKKLSCTESFEIFGYSRSTIVGVYAGAEAYQYGMHESVLDRMLDHILRDVEKRNTTSEAHIIQLCPGNDLGADYMVGIIAAPAADLLLAQKAVQSWADGRCMSGNLRNYMKASLRVSSQAQDSNSTNIVSFSTSTKFSKEAHDQAIPNLAQRATCKAITVFSGDNCFSLAKRCDISQSDLQKYNSVKGFCSALVIGQTICCSPGSLPDPIPLANTDGGCKTKSVSDGDTCESMAQKCALKPADFARLHSDDKDFCSNLVVGQPVCCTYGKLPDVTPKPSKDGSCFTYTIQQGDSCAVIAASHGLTVDDIDEYNKRTWGWNGCKLLSVKAQICLSTGTPPFPVSIANAVCGPQVPGTKRPSSGDSSDWARLNSCPLNACCNVWGQCGTTDDFCVNSKSITGAPGTAAVGKNGCKSRRICTY